jgi:hypothetical protein
MRCLRPISPRCFVRSPSKPWRSLPSRPPGCLRTPPRSPSRGPMRTTHRRRELRGLRTGIAKTVVTISHRCSAGWACVGMAAFPCASGCGMATAAIVWRRPWRLQSVWPWAWRGCVGSWRIVKPIVAARWGYVSSTRSMSSPEFRGRVPSARHSKPGASSNPHCPSCWSSLGGRRTKRRAVGMAQACAARWRSHTAMGASSRWPCALSWCMRVNWPSSTRRPLPLPKRKPPPPWPTTCGTCTPGGSPVYLMPKRRSPRIPARGRDTVGAAHACGALRHDRHPNGGGRVDLVCTSRASPLMNT